MCFDVSKMFKIIVCCPDNLSQFQYQLGQGETKEFGHQNPLQNHGGTFLLHKYSLAQYKGSIRAALIDSLTNPRASTSDH